MQKSLIKRVDFINRFLKKLPLVKTSFVLIFFEKSFWPPKPGSPKKSKNNHFLWKSDLEYWFYYCLLEQVLFRLILAIPEHSFCLCVSSFFEFDFRDSNSIYGFLYDALCVNIFFFYSLLFVNVLLWVAGEWEFGSLKWRKTLKITHAWDEKCILLLNIWPRIKRKDDCSHPRNIHMNHR